jgi:hypothetical protein
MAQSARFWPLTRDNAAPFPARGSENGSAAAQTGRFQPGRPSLWFDFAAFGFLVKTFSLKKMIPPRAVLVNTQKEWYNF